MKSFWALERTFSYTKLLERVVRTVAGQQLMSKAFLGVGMHTIPNLPNGALNLNDIQSAIRHDDPHYPRYN